MKINTLLLLCCIVSFSLQGMERNSQILGQFDDASSYAELGLEYEDATVSHEYSLYDLQDIETKQKKVALLLCSAIQANESCENIQNMLINNTIFANVNTNICSQSLVYTSPVCFAAHCARVDVLQLFLNHKSFVPDSESEPLAHALPFSTCAFSEEHIHNQIQCIQLLSDAGVKDTGYALHYAMRFARQISPEYYKTLPYFKRAGSDANRQNNFGSALHQLLNPYLKYGINPCPEALKTLLKDFNANPFCFHINTKETPYLYAKRWKEAGIDEYFQIIEQHSLKPVEKR